MAAEAVGYESSVEVERGRLDGSWGSRDGELASSGLGLEASAGAAGDDSSLGWGRLVGPFGASSVVGASVGAGE